MHPALLLLGLQALNKQGAASEDTNLSAYALTTWGWLVVRLPWDMYVVIGNDFAFNTNNKGVFQLRYGSDATAQKAWTSFKQYLNLAPALPGSQLLPQRETAFARWYANPRLIGVKWRGFVWALDEHNNIATVTSGHFLGKCLQGTQTSCSDLISTLLKQPGADLVPLTSSTVGHGPHCRTAWR
jgi:hypothetical protein